MCRTIARSLRIRWLEEFFLITSSPAFYPCPEAVSTQTGFFFRSPMLCCSHAVVGQTEEVKIMALEEAKQKKLIAAILAILLGSLGIHKFYLGYVVAGIIQLALSFFLGIGGIIGLIEGIIYLVKSDDEFESGYVNGNKDKIKFF